MYRLLILCATAAVVPEPKKLSSTKSPSFVAIKRILSINFSGFFDLGKAMPPSFPKSALGMSSFFQTFDNFVVLTTSFFSRNAVSFNHAHSSPLW